MTASQTIGTIAYTDTVPAKNNTSSAKSYTDNSSNFEDIFNSVNKAYDSSASVANSSGNNTKTSNTANPANAKPSDNKVADNQNSQKTDSSNVNKQDEQTKTPQEVKTNTQEQTHTAQNSDTKKTRDNANKDNKDDNQKEDNDDNTNSNSEKTTSQDTQTQTVDNAVSQALKNVDTSAQVPTDTQTKTQTQTATDQQSVQQAQQVPDGTDITKVVQNLNDIVENKTNQVSIQTQTQQVLSDVKIDPDENKKQTPDNKDSEKQADTKTPVIAASTEAIAGAANVKTADADKSQNLNDVMAKTSLTQDVIDKTNAKVVSVETSTSNSNNLLNKENAEEQTIKLALETNSNHASNSADAMTQSNFAKTLDSVQSEAPKELNKTDVMSQVHSQLDKLQDEATTKVTIVLKPENLGKINLELTSGKDGITARMTTDSAQVKELLDKNIDGLKNSLGTQGVNVNNVTVKVAEAPKAPSSDMFSFNDQAGKENQQQQSNNQGAGGGNQSSYNEETTTAGELSETDLETENPVSTGAHSGQIDYQV